MSSGYAVYNSGLNNIIFLIETVISKIHSNEIWQYQNHILSGTIAR
jgi:hypothetical protein